MNWVVILECVLLSVATFVAFLFGCRYGRREYERKAASGKLIMDVDNPEADIFRLQIDEDLYSIATKDKVIFDIVKNSRN